MDILAIINNIKKKRPELAEDPMFGELEAAAMGGDMESTDDMSNPMAGEAAADAMADEGAAMAAEGEAMEDEEEEDFLAELEPSAKPKPKKKKKHYLDEERVSPPGQITGSY